jgi:hypothetical protein
VRDPLFLPIVVLSTVASVAISLGSAADLRVQGGTIQAGTEHVLKYDEDGVWTARWGLDLNSGMVSSVTVGDFEEDNFGNHILVVITGADHQEIARSESVIDASEMIFVLDHPVQACAIYDIHICLEGFRILV